MRTLTIGLLFSSLVWTASACQGDGDEEKPASESASTASRLVPQVKPPLDLKAPPDDASKTASGLAYKKLTSRDAGALPQRSDTVVVHYTGWRQRTGETFFTTKGNNQPMSIDVGHAAPGFGEALQLLRKGEKAVLWVPLGPGISEPLAYEIEVVDIVPPPKVAEPTPPGQSRPTGSAASRSQPLSKVH
jgi:peptidylprolyl isomerase